MSAEPADLKQAWQLYYAKKYQDSIGLCENILQEQPQDMYAQCLLYRCRYRLEDTVAAEQWLAQVFTQDQACAPAYELRGFLLSENKDHNAAIPDFNEAIRLDPQYAYAYFNRGIAYKNKSDYNAAIRDFNEAIRLDPQYAYAYFNRGIVYANKGDYGAAIHDYNEGIRLDPQNSDAYYIRGDAYKIIGNYNTAINDYNEAISLDSNNAKAYFNRGEVYANKGYYDAAIRDYNEAIRLDPQYKSAYNNRGIAYSDKGNNDAAINYYNRSIRLDSQNADTYYNRGVAYDDKGNRDAAIRDYSEAIRLDPQYKNAYINRGIAYSEKGNHDAAIRDYSEAIRLNPQDPDTYVNRGIAYSDKGDHDAAIRDYNEAIRINPQDSDTYVNRGVAYSDKGDHDAAIRDYNEAIRLDSQIGDAYNNLKNSYSKINKQGKTLSVIAQKSQISITKYKNKDADVQYWHDAIFRHLKNRILPLVKQSNDRFVHYWHISIRWGARTSQSVIVDGNTSIVHQGSYGAGYIALTERDLYIVNLGEISRRFMNKRGLLGKAFLLMLRNLDMTRRETSDLVFTFPHTDIYSLSRQEGLIILNTGSQSWVLTPFFDEDSTLLYTALSFAREHKVSSLFEPLYESKQSTAPIAATVNTDEVLQAIEKLKKLLDLGAVTQKEFEEKKKELLARI